MVHTRASHLAQDLATKLGMLALTLTSYMHAAYVLCDDHFQVRGGGVRYKERL